MAIEAWHRGRTDIEDRFRDAKHGAALIHLPSGDPGVNTAWLWAALLALALSAWLQELAGLDHGDGRGRAHLARLRRELLCVPARLIRHGRALILRPAPGQHGVLAAVPARLHAYRRRPDPCLPRPRPASPEPMELRPPEATSGPPACPAIRTTSQSRSTLVISASAWRYLRIRV